MKTIEIVTAHNVVIEHELAPVIRRALALFLDLAILFTYYLLCYILISSFNPSIIEETPKSNLMYLIIFLLCIPVFFYSFLCETLFAGQSIGKMALKIRVVKLSGINPSIADYFLRWTFRLIDCVMTFGALALLVSLSSDKNQRLGDVVANTCVIKLIPSKKYNIDDILIIKSKKDYKARYNEVVGFTDNDMLLIKKTLSRIKKTPNAKQRLLINELSNIVAEKLNISEVPKDKVTFLKTLLHDYVVLTRS